ncbi:MAG: hypothetical protein AAFP03_16740 [Cyanobacteria bacterium J06598_3]
MSDLNLPITLLTKQLLQLASFMESVEFYTTQFEMAGTTNNLIVQQPVVGQYFDQDLGETTGEILTGFYESGQLWALLIGIVFGYIVRGAFSYGS